MSHRRKKDPPGTISVNWGRYQPHEPLYWKFGGPFVPVEQIEAMPFRSESLYSYDKNPAVRLKHVAEALARDEADLAKQIAYYEELNAQGIDALRHEWLRESDCNMAKDGDAWTHAPSNVDQHQATSFNRIKDLKGRIAACKRVLDALDGVTAPLLHWRKDA